MVRIEFNTDGAWFSDYYIDDDCEGGLLDMWRVADAVHKIADSIHDGYRQGVILDGNGNRVGKFTVE